MAILKGAEAQAWLAANPGRKYKVLSNPAQDQSQDGLFMSFA